MKIVKPTFLVDKEKCVSNIERMLNKARGNNIIIRPHFKTHQSADIGNWFRDFGISKITVSSLDMALYFAENGWDDITVAFPVNILEIDKINFLAGNISLSLLAESEEAIVYLERNLLKPVDLYFKVDVGYGRTGIHYSDIQKFISLKKVLDQTKLVRLKGLLTHAGHTYKAKSVDEIINIKNQSLARMVEIKTVLGRDMLISYGDTPSCSIAENFSGADEIRPGNFVFYDLTQYNLGVCSFEDISCCIAVPVVSKPSNNKSVLYCGAVHLSKENLELRSGENSYGQVVLFNDNWTWNEPQINRHITSLSQEHGILENCDAPDPGNVIGIIPVHSCLAANLFRNYFTTEGEMLNKF